MRALLRSVLRALWMPVVRRALLILVLILLAGTVAFHLLERWPILTALYFTAATITTVGYGDVTPATGAGRALSVVLMFSGIGLASYVLADLAQLLLHGEFSMAIREDELRRRVQRARDHLIVCGYGRTGRRVARLATERYRFEVVVIDRDREACESAIVRGLPAIQGDATQEETLREANVERARALVVCTGDDRTNVFVTLLARNLNPNLHVTAVAHTREGERLLRRAGADEVVFIHDCASRHIVRAALSPLQLRITVRHTVDEIRDVMSIIVGYGGVVQCVEYYTPPLRTPIRREVLITDMREVLRFVERLERKPSFRRALERVYAISENVHSYCVVVHDEKERDRILRELDRRGYLIGVDLSVDEILEEIERIRGSG